MSKTGWLQVVDAAALAAIQAQVEIVNEAGGINGLPLRLEVIDIASDLNESFQGGKRMAGDQAAAVFVSCDQEFALPAVQETLNSIVTVIPCPVSQWWQRDNVFTFGVSPATEGRALAAQVQNTQARSAVVFSDRDSGFSEDVCQQFVQTFQGSGGMVRQVVPISFASSPSQFRTVVQQSSLAQVDVVVICSVLPTGRNLYNAIRSQGILTPVVANSQLEGDWMEADRRQGAIGVLSYGSVWGDDPAEAVNRLIAAKQPGSIINISSISGRRPAHKIGGYAASKAAVEHLTHSFALELARYNIRVNAIAPGYFRTDMNAEMIDSEVGEVMRKRITMRRYGQYHDLD